MTEFYIVREFNGGVQFKPQKVYALKNYFSQWFYTFEECQKECEIRQANVVMQTTTDLDVLKKKVAELEWKKTRLVNAGLHPESRKLYETLPRVGGWQDVTYDPSLSIFLGNIYQQKIKKLGVQPVRNLNIGFEFVVDVPSDAIEVIVQCGTAMIKPTIEGDKVKRIRFKQHKYGATPFTIYAKLSQSATEGAKATIEEFRTGRWPAAEPNKSNDAQDALRYAIAGHTFGNQRPIGLDEISRWPAKKFPSMAQERIFSSAIRCGKSMLTDELFKEHIKVLAAESKSGSRQIILSNKTMSWFVLAGSLRDYHRVMSENPTLVEVQAKPIRDYNDLRGLEAFGIVHTETEAKREGYSKILGFIAHVRGLRKIIEVNL